MKESNFNSAILYNEDKDVVEIFALEAKDLYCRNC